MTKFTFEIQMMKVKLIRSVLHLNDKRQNDLNNRQFDILEVQAQGNNSVEAKLKTSSKSVVNQTKGHSKLQVKVKVIVEWNLI